MDKINFIAGGLFQGLPYISLQLSEHEGAILKARWINTKPIAALENLSDEAMDEGWPEAERQAIVVFIQKYQEEKEGSLIKQLKSFGDKIKSWFN